MDRKCKQCREPESAHCPDCGACCPDEIEHPDWCGQS